MYNDLSKIFRKGDTVLNNTEESSFNKEVGEVFDVAEKYLEIHWKTSNIVYRYNAKGEYLRIIKELTRLNIRYISNI